MDRQLYIMYRKQKQYFQQIKMSLTRVFIVLTKYSIFLPIVYIIYTGMVMHIWIDTITSPGSAKETQSVWMHKKKIVGGLNYEIVSSIHRYSIANSSRDLLTARMKYGIHVKEDAIANHVFLVFSLGLVCYFKNECTIN